LSGRKNRRIYYSSFIAIVEPRIDGVGEHEETKLNESVSSEMKK